MNIIITDRISIEANSNYDRDRHSASMFKEDILNCLSRYGLNFDQVECSLSINDTEFIKYLHETLPTQRSSYNLSLKNIVFDFAQLILNHILNIGYCALEIVEYEDIKKFKHTRLISFFGDEIQLEKDNLVQIVKEEKGTSKMELPHEKYFFIPLPIELGEHKEFEQFITLLNHSDELSPAMKFLHSNLNNVKGYDYKEHMRLHEIESWKLTNKYSWTHRSSKSEYFTSYFHIKKQIEFKLMQIKIRDYVLKEMSNIIKTLSRKFGNINSITISGLKPKSDVEEVLNRWESGEVMSNEIISILS